MNAALLVPAGILMGGCFLLLWLLHRQEQHDKQNTKQQ